MNIYIYMQGYEKLNGFVKHFSSVSNINIEYDSKSHINQSNILTEDLQNSTGAWENP